MQNNIGLPNFKYTDEDGTHIFTENDNVICCTKDEKKYVGKIVALANCQENKDSENELAICIGAFKNNNYSVDVVKVADITYICHNPINDLIGYPATNEKEDKAYFVKMIETLGCDEEYAEHMYEDFKGMVNLYNIPLSAILARSIQDVWCKNGSEQIEFEDIWKRCVLIMVELFQNTTNGIKEKLESKADGVLQEENA